MKKNKKIKKAKKIKKIKKAKKIKKNKKAKKIKLPQNKEISTPVPGLRITKSNEQKLEIKKIKKQASEKKFINLKTI